MKRIRIQLLVIALCLAVTTSILGLSAYLTDSQDYSSTFHTIKGSELGFLLDGEQYDDKTIKPGELIPLNIVASVDNSDGLYVFINFKYSPEFKEPVGFDKTIWHSIEDKSTVYYYGTDSKILALGSSDVGTSAKIVESVTLPQTAKAGQDFYVTVEGYAISTDNIPANASPKDIFTMIVGTTTNNSDASQNDGSNTQNGGD